MSLKERIRGRFSRRPKDNEEFVEMERKHDEEKRKRFLEKNKTEEEDFDLPEGEDDVVTIHEEQPVIKEATVIDNKRRETHRERATRIGNKAADKIEGGVKTVDRYHKKADRMTNKVMLKKEQAEMRIRKERRRAGESVMSAASHDVNVNWDFVLSKNRPVGPSKPKMGSDPLLAFYGSGKSKKEIRRPDNPKDDPLMRMYGAGRSEKAKKKDDDPLISMYRLGGSSQKKKGPDPLLNLYKLPSRKKGGLLNV